jgi:Domain of unknown function (DUF4124)
VIAAGKKCRPAPGYLLCLGCVLAGSALLPRSHAEEVYKTTDANGHVVYSDRPSSPQSQKVTVPVTPADAGEAARLAKQHALEDAEFAQRSRQEADAQTRQAAQARQDADRCSAARNHYAVLRDVRRLFQVDADGNRVFYSDEQADAMRAAAKQAMEQACGK